MLSNCNIICYMYLKRSNTLNSHGETLVSVLVWILLLTTIVFWIANFLGKSAGLEADIQNQTLLNILVQNSSTLIQNTDTTKIAENEVFYLYKDVLNKKIQVFTWATNAGYAYINTRGEFITNTGTTQDIIYSRSFKIWAKASTLYELPQIIQNIYKVNKF